MNFANNLHFLRKRDKVTQEELADRLGVSRQSVSKWETGEAYPETDKLIVLCDIFHVSLDDMIRSDMTCGKHDEQETAEQQPAEQSLALQQSAVQSLADKQSYVAHVDKFSKLIAVGVFAILIGVAVFFVLNGIGLVADPEYYEEFFHVEEFFQMMSVVAITLFCALAVFLFVFAKIRHGNYLKTHTYATFELSETQTRAPEKRFAICMASLISGILLDVVLLVALSYVQYAKELISQYLYAALCFVFCVFFVILACLMCGIVYLGTKHRKYKLKESTQKANMEQPKE